MRPSLVFALVASVIAVPLASENKWDRQKIQKQLKFLEAPKPGDKCGSRCSQEKNVACDWCAGTKAERQDWYCCKLQGSSYASEDRCHTDNALYTSLDRKNSVCTLSCSPGWRVAADNVSCMDEDECSNGSAECDAQAVCYNTPGSYICTSEENINAEQTPDPGCNPGFTGDGQICDDIDECANGEADCPVHSICANSPGSFTCTCQDGFKKNADGSCDDIDECDAGVAMCSPQAVCANTHGSYVCTSKDASKDGVPVSGCNHGWTGDGKTCTDIDECANGEADCDGNAGCTNTPGSFTCQCREDYEDDGDAAVGAGRSCKRKPGPLCPTYTDCDACVGAPPPPTEDGSVQSCVWSHAAFSSGNNCEPSGWVEFKKEVDAVADDCTITCTCSTPNAGADGHNEMKCTNGEGRFCASGDVCFAEGPTAYGDWAAMCRTEGFLLFQDQQSADPHLMETNCPTFTKCGDCQANPEERNAMRTCAWSQAGFSSGSKCEPMGFVLWHDETIAVSEVCPCAVYDTRVGLKAALEAEVDSPNAECPPNEWDVSAITDMEAVASDIKFNGDISKWDVSRVTSMKSMFNDAKDFNGDISSWDVSRVTTMNSMLDEASLFNGDISKWNVSKVVDMESMFESAIGFNSDISKWDVSRVTNNEYMFLDGFKGERPKFDKITECKDDDAAFNTAWSKRYTHRKPYTCDYNKKYCVGAGGMHDDIRDNCPKTCQACKSDGYGEVERPAPLN